MNTACFIEIGQSTVRVLYGERVLEWSLDRSPNGRLSEACRQRVQLAFQDLLPKSTWGARPRILCAIGARGVSLRRLSVPATGREALHRLLRLQIESEFPLPPDDLAWGYQRLGECKPQNGSPAQQELLVMAVKKEVVEDYAQFFPDGGSTPDFTLAALARGYLCPATIGDYAILELGTTASEWIQFENGIPVAVRTLSWGGDTISQVIAERLGVSREEAERLKAEAGLTGGSPGVLVQEAFDAALESLLVALKEHKSVKRLYLTGSVTQLRQVAARLSQKLGGAVCEPLEPGRTGSAALAGLNAATRNGQLPLMFQLEAKPANGATRIARPAPWKWASLAALLVASWLVLPYLEAFLLQPRLARKLAGLKSDMTRLAMIDQELGFLRDLKQSQSPYLDTLYLLAKSAPMGARIESLSMNRRGDLALRGSLKDLQQVADFRARLINSGLFANVTIEEQTPTPDRQKLMVRLSAQWKPAATRQNLALGPTPEEIEKAKTAKKDTFSGVPPPPPGFSGPSSGRIPVVAGLRGDSAENKAPLPPNPTGASAGPVMPPPPKPAR